MGNFLDDFLDAVTGNDHSTEVHDDDSYTDRYNDTNTSLTYNSDGSLREQSYSEPQFPGSSSNWQVTEDGDGNVVNVQDRND
jgi:hypothetical protein